jgi:hypothetical protein
MPGRTPYEAYRAFVTPLLPGAEDEYERGVGGEYVVV